jgi:hypothetical protein
MPLSIKDRKILWARSGNICSFPGCDQVLVEWLGQDGLSTVVGEEAHIVPRSANGPRGMAGSDPSESAANYLLLCPTHHRVIDERPDIYTIDALRAIKQDHESRVRSQLASHSQSQILIAAGYSSACAGNRAVNAWRVGPSTVIVCSFGSDPTPEAEDHWRGAGLEFRCIHDTLGAEQLYLTSEANFDVQYWLHEKALYIVQHTYDPTVQDIVPFIEHRFDVQCIPTEVSRRVLLHTQLDAAPTIDQLVLRINTAPGELYTRDHEIALYELRNAGLAAPTAVLEKLREFQEKPWCDGALAEEVASIEQELRLIQQMRGAI